MSIPQARANWSWANLPEDDERPTEFEGNLPPQGAFAEYEDEAGEANTDDGQPEEPAAQQIPPHFKPRTCRICLEEVLPTLEPLSDGISSRISPAPKVLYISTDPESGRLLSPCKCRGSQKYVHEGCLQAWRHADPSMATRNYWECPTCKFRYRLERLKWSRMISSTLTQIAITIAIMFGLVFAFGFVADPIINLYLDPLDTITSLPAGGTAMLLEDEDASWAEHFLKGLASLGLLGFVKVFFAMSPWHWWNLRNSGILGGGGRRRRGTGRDRLEDISWTVVIIGVITFLAALWTWVRAWTARTLDKAGEKVADVQGEEDGDIEETSEPTPAQNTTENVAPAPPSDATADAIPASHSDTTAPESRKTQ